MIRSSPGIPPGKILILFSNPSYFDSDGKYSLDIDFLNDSIPVFGAYTWNSFELKSIEFTISFISISTTALTPLFNSKYFSPETEDAFLTFCPIPTIEENVAFVIFIFLWDYNYF